MLQSDESAAKQLRELLNKNDAPGKPEFDAAMTRGLNTATTVDSGDTTTAGAGFRWGPDEFWMSATAARIALRESRGA
jgi:hypothetical protein